MKSFNFFVDERYALWIRHYVSIEADSLEEALKKCINGDYLEDHSEDLWETAKLLTPEENGGNPTLEVYSADSDKYDALYTNAES